MRFDPPRIQRGPLSGRIYCVTHGKILKVEDGVEYIQASVKYDVTEQIAALVGRAGERCALCRGTHHSTQEHVDSLSGAA